MLENLACEKWEPASALDVHWHYAGRVGLVGPRGIMTQLISAASLTRANSLAAQTNTISGTGKSGPKEVHNSNCMGTSATSQESLSRSRREGVAELTIMIGSSGSDGDDWH